MVIVNAFCYRNDTEAAWRREKGGLGMYYFLSVLSGLMIAGMIAVNGELTTAYGVYTASVIIHMTGLVLVGLILLLRKKRLFQSGRPPLPFFLGGVIGSLTTVFNNAAFGGISVSAILALGLLGQSITSILLDHFGLLQMPRRTFSLIKLPGLAFVLLGIFVINPEFSGNRLLPALLSLLAGATVVLSRTVNAMLAKSTDDLTSTLFNYITGLLCCLLLLLIAGRGEPLPAGTATAAVPPERIWIFFGGWIGVGVVFLSNVTVKRISAFYMTLLVFLGQVFTGILLDMLLTQAFSAGNLLGGILVAAGLILNLLIDQRKKPPQE